MSQDNLKKTFKELSLIFSDLSKDNKISEKYQFFLKKMVDALNQNKTIFFCGNGGSFADSQHLATELVVRFKKNREAINANVLGSNQCNLTAIGNDFSFEEIFVRELSALYKKGDVVIILSTSGNSKNIIKVAEFLNLKGEKALAITGKGGGGLIGITDNLVIPSNDTATIQEVTIVIGHSLCSEIERISVKNKRNFDL